MTKYQKDLEFKICNKSATAPSSKQRDSACPKTHPFTHGLVKRNQARITKRASNIEMHPTKYGKRNSRMSGLKADKSELSNNNKEKSHVLYARLQKLHVQWLTHVYDWIDYHISPEAHAAKARELDHQPRVYSARQA